MSGLTNEQLANIERKKQAAIELRAARLREQNKKEHGPIASTTPAIFYQNSTKSTSSNIAQPYMVKQSSSTDLANRNASYSNKAQDVSISRTTTSSTSIYSGSGGRGLGDSAVNYESNKPSAFSNKPTCNTAVKYPIGSNNSSGLQASSMKVGQIRTGQCIMISRERFRANISYHKPSIDIFRTMKSALYDSETKTWSFLIRDHENLLKAMKPVSSELKLGGLPSIILKTFRENHSALDSKSDIDLSRIDDVLITSLMPFQRKGINFGISKNGRCLIADDMGLGKTIQALGIVHYYKEDWPLLIVSPSSVRYLWEEAIMNWLPSVPMHQVVVMTSGKDYISEAQVLILSYDLLSRHLQELTTLRFGAIILDECHFLKNMNAERTKAALKLIRAAKRVLLLSGTPALSRPKELYPQLIAIDTNFFRFQDFGIRYCAGKQSKFGWDFNGSSNMEELQLLLTSRYMIRRLKSDVITQLPSKRRQMVILCPDNVRSSSKEMKKYVTMLESTALKGMERRGTLMEYYNKTGSAKLKAIQEYVSDLLESGQKFICFAHHKTVLDGICSTIASQNKKCIRIDGSTNPKIRQQLCDAFQEDCNVVAAVLSITAANAGITLTAAHLVVFAELFWNPGILTQAEDRAHRIGQQDSVVVRYLVAKGTADDHLWPLIIQKLDVLNKAGLSKDNFGDNESIHLKDSKQKTINSYFEIIPDDFLSDEADGWLSGINLDEYNEPEKKQRLC